MILAKLMDNFHFLNSQTLGYNSVIFLLNSIPSFLQVLEAKIGKPPNAGGDCSKLTVEIAFGKHRFVR